MDVSDHALALSRDCELIDLHLDSFIPWRLFGYDPLRRHGRGVLRGRFFGHTDLPRAQAGGLSAGMWCLTTNPFRTARGRWGAFQRNLERVRALISRAEGQLAFARSRAEYDAVRAAGAHAVLLAVQGGNAFDAAPEGPASAPDRLLTRVTLVHLTNARAGATSAPFGLLRPNKGLTEHGRRMVAQCNAARIFVDLAHIHPRSFWDAVAVHDASQPLIVTHTGVDGVKRHWRNLDDRQIRAVTDTGGVVGVMFHSGYLRRRGGPRDGAAVVEHMEHIIEVGGEHAVALGTDFDGFILPPGDLRYGDSYPRLVQHMLNRGWPEARIRGALGENFLRSWALLRPS